LQADSLFLCRAEAAVGMRALDIGFRADLVEAITWAITACSVWPDQHDELLKIQAAVASRCATAAKAAESAAAAMREMSPELWAPFSYRPELLEDFANELRRVGDLSASRRAQSLRRSLSLGTRSANGGRPLMIGFTGLVALLAKAYQRSVGCQPAVNFSAPQNRFSGPFVRLVDEAVAAIGRAQSTPGEPSPEMMAFRAPASAYARGRYIERVLKALRPNGTETEIQNLLGRIGFVD
jgi:hypothetical protein